MVRQASFLELSGPTNFEQLMSHCLAAILLFRHFDFGGGPCQAEVAKHQVAILIEQNVSWLEISVHHIRLVEEVECTKKTEQDRGGVLLGEANILFAQDFL